MSWAIQPERGGDRTTRAALFLALKGGRLLAPVLAAGATAWFLLTSGPERAASHDYLRRVLGRPARLIDVARHFYNFASVVVDRVLLLGGREREFAIRTMGADAVVAALKHGRGCILLGGHLGSFGALRALARQSPVPVWALMYRRNAGVLTSLLDRLAPGLYDQVLEIGDTSSMIRARECVERGEILGILADRAPPGHRTMTVPFFGDPAPFPIGPFVLANLLATPVVLFHAVRTGPLAYDVIFEPFADRVSLRRDARQQDLRGVVTRYAEALQQGCQRYPYQWFNFFSFWNDAQVSNRKLKPDGEAGMTISRLPPEVEHEITSTSADAEHMG